LLVCEVVEWVCGEVLVRKKGKKKQKKQEQESVGRWRVRPVPVRRCSSPGYCGTLHVVSPDLDGTSTW
jgi:hypothetical protein